MYKKSIRLLVQEKITLLSPEKKIKESTEVCRKLQDILSEKKSRTLIVYLPLSDELDISPLTLWCKNQGWNVTILSQKNVPFPEITEECIIIVPGRAFTIEGKRIGRGGGFYDTLLSEKPNLESIGVCFNCQIVDNIVEDSWDRRVDEVVFAQNTLE